jgi:hypothetical protein
VSGTKVKYTNPGCPLAEAVRMIKSAMQYVEGSALVTFTVDHAGYVTGFRLANNHDAPATISEPFRKRLQTEQRERRAAELDAQIAALQAERSRI